MSSEIDERLKFAHRLADAAGAAIRPFFRQPMHVTNKDPGRFDPVTEADRAAEKIIRERIQKAYPEDGILGEELGEVKGSNEFRWVIDPIDGTRAFIAGLPLWGTLIALEENEAPVLGLLDQPFLHERFIGYSGATEITDGHGTRPLKARVCAHIADAVICTTHPRAHFDETQSALFARIEKEALLSRYGGDCYAYAMLAMGFVDLVMEANLSPWDVAAIVPIIEGAGGVATDWHGGLAHRGGSMLAAGDTRVHAEALALIRS